ncbi:retrotransposon-like protein 1 [Sorochytrium milnesiophthora]
MGEDNPRVTCDSEPFLEAFNTCFGGYDPALKTKHAFNTLLSPLVDGKKLAVEALLDSGATHDLMDRKFARYHGVPYSPLADPRQSNMADGSEPKVAMFPLKTDDLDYTTGDLKCKAPFYLTTLGHS